MPSKYARDDDTIQRVIIVPTDQHTYAHPCVIMVRTDKVSLYCPLQPLALIIINFLTYRVNDKRVYKNDGSAPERKGQSHKPHKENFLHP